MGQKSTNSNEPPKWSSATVLVVAGAVGSLLLCSCGCGIWIVTLAVFNPTPEQWDQTILKQAEAHWKQQEQLARTDQERSKAFILFWVQLLHMKNLDVPYRRLSPDQQARMSREQF